MTPPPPAHTYHQLLPAAARKLHGGNLQMSVSPNLQEQLKVGHMLSEAGGKLEAQS
jgi:hypothetical protein